MGITNGFARIDRNDYVTLVQKAASFEHHLATVRRNENTEYLDMDKAGWGLMIILDSGLFTEKEREAKNLYPHIIKILSSGEAPFENLDLGYGAPRIVNHSDLIASCSEFENLDFEAILERAIDDDVCEMLMVEVDEREFREYYWPYLLSLRDFVKSAISGNQIVVRF